jgi:biopolymer transport protein TolR
MGLTVPSSKGGVVSDVNVVPLIDVLLVLLVIFMIIPHQQTGLQAALPQQASETNPVPPPAIIVVEVAADGSIRLNQEVVPREELQNRLERVFALRTERTAFLQGDRSLEFETVASVLNDLHVAGASPVGLLTSELEKKR